LKLAKDSVRSSLLLLLLFVLTGDLMIGVTNSTEVTFPNNQ
ncbi:28317_t:CDS:1, partial [Dentiscutata erythropus]